MARLGCQISTAMEQIYRYRYNILEGLILACKLTLPKLNSPSSHLFTGKLTISFLLISSSLPIGGDGEIIKLPLIAGTSPLTQTNSALTY